MAARAIWQGYLQVAELGCQVALFAAASTSERTSFHMLNRSTGHRVHRRFVDEETGAEVSAGDQVKGYETGAGTRIVLEPQEIAAVLPESDKRLTIQRFVPCAAVGTLFIDRPYFVAPRDDAAREAYGLIAEGLRSQNVAALACAVLFRRVRTVLLRAHDATLLASTLHFGYELRAPGGVFDAIGTVKVTDEMLSLARHIIATKQGRFDPQQFDDRYDTALAALVKAKQQGRKLPTRPKAAPARVPDLMEALRRSASGASEPDKLPPKRSKSRQPAHGAQRDRAAAAGHPAPRRRTAG